MRQFEYLFTEIIKYEGYYANIVGDRGGETYMGIARNLHPKWKGWVIIDKYKLERGKIKWNEKINIPGLLELVKDFYKKTFYNKYHIALIDNDSLKLIIFDWCVNSGLFAGIKIQKLLNKSFEENLDIDGSIGSITAIAINRQDPKELFDAIKKERIAYYQKIAKLRQNGKFLVGWLRRINSINYI